MGGSYWNDDFYKDRQAAKQASNTPTFAYDHAVRTGKAKAVAHDKMSPKGAMRESRDSAAHPESIAIMVMFDDTGSMGEIPVQLQQQLPQLMGMLGKTGVKDPQILFGAVGDYHSDKVPLQVGQFESGVEMDEDLTRIFIEKGGGGQQPPRESYQLALYFAARHTSIDCFEKRQKKGYLFIIGDEGPYAVTTKQEAQDVFGDGAESDVPVETLVKEAKEKYHVFYLLPANASHGRDPWVRNRWSELIGEENVLRLDHAENICEVVSSVVGTVEGTMRGGIREGLGALGATPDAVEHVSRVLDGLAKSVARSRVAGTAPAAATGSRVERL